MHAWVVVAIVIAGLLVIRLANVVYGTLTKNKWGINLRPVSCPRCGARIPVIREPRSLQQFWEGNWTCPVCGIEGDKWGREVAPVGPGPIDSMAQCKIRIQAAKRGMIRFFPIAFCIALLQNLFLLKRELFPLTWGLALTLVIPAILEVATIGLIVYVCARFIIKIIYSQKGKRLDSAPANESGQTPKA